MKQKQRAKVKNLRTKNYPVEYLAVILGLVLISEGALFGIASGIDWQQGASLLNVNSTVSELSQNLTVVFSPITDQAASVNQFYQLSASEMTPLLNMDDQGFGSEIELVVNGVYDFYQQASVQMADILNMSNVALANFGN